MNFNNFSCLVLGANVPKYILENIQHNLAHKTWYRSKSVVLEQNVSKYILENI